MGHTPGPWKANNVSGAVKVYGSNKPNIAWVTCDDDRRLIAAAPDLLEACKEAIDYINGHNDNEGCYTPNIIRKLEQAISKAEKGDN